MAVHGFNTIIVQLMPNYSWNQLVVPHSGRKAISLDGMTTLHRTIWHDKQKNYVRERKENDRKSPDDWLKWGGAETGKETEQKLEERRKCTSEKKIESIWEKTRLTKDQAGKKVKAFFPSKIVSSKMNHEEITVKIICIKC